MTTPKSPKEILEEFEKNFMQVPGESCNTSDEWDMNIQRFGDYKTFLSQALEDQRQKIVEMVKSHEAIHKQIIYEHTTLPIDWHKGQIACCDALIERLKEI